MEMSIGVSGFSSWLMVSRQAFSAALINCFCAASSSSARCAKCSTAPLTALTMRGSPVIFNWTRVGSVGTASWVGQPNVTGLAAIRAVILPVLRQLNVILALAQHAETVAGAILLRPVALRAEYVPTHGYKLYATRRAAHKRDVQRECLPLRREPVLK